jgi:pimeloyl-ACP methyl ester carboxylesterase
MKIIANRIRIEVEDSHPQGGGRPTVLLIMGLGMQLIAWPPAFVDALVAAGFRVVRFDNRDIGLSQHFDEFGTPNLLWESVKYRFGWRMKPPYTIEDMARDSLGVLDALHIESAHLVGVSMGGMIAQRVALMAPARSLSLSSIMSTSGARGLPEAEPRVSRVLLSRPAGPGREAEIDQAVRLFRAIGSPAFPTDEADLRETIRESIARSDHPAGFARQLVAAVADTARANLLSQLTLPTLVVHGRADPLVRMACGEDTARRIPGARFVAVDGMGHDLSPGVVDRLLPLLLPHLRSTTPQSQSSILHEPA